MLWQTTKGLVKHREKFWNTFISTVFVGKAFAGVVFLELLFVRTVFVEVLFVTSINSSHVITELSIILPTYLLFSQVHVAGLWI